MDLECTNGELKEEVETLEVIHSYSYCHIQEKVHGHTYKTIKTFAAQCYKGSYLIFEGHCTVLAK